MILKHMQIHHATVHHSVWSKLRSTRRKEEGRNVLVMIKGIVTIISLDPPLLLRNLISTSSENRDEDISMTQVPWVLTVSSFSALVRQSLYFTCICFVYALCFPCRLFPLASLCFILLTYIRLYVILATQYKLSIPTWLFAWPVCSISLVNLLTLFPILVWHINDVCT